MPRSWESNHNHHPSSSATGGGSHALLTEDHIKSLQAQAPSFLHSTPGSVHSPPTTVFHHTARSPRTLTHPGGAVTPSSTIQQTSPHLPVAGDSSSTVTHADFDPSVMTRAPWATRPS